MNAYFSVNHLYKNRQLIFQALLYREREKETTRFTLAPCRGACHPLTTITALSVYHGMVSQNIKICAGLI
jgi:hypothetical protein